MVFDPAWYPVFYHGFTIPIRRPFSQEAVLHPLPVSIPPEKLNLLAATSSVLAQSPSHCFCPIWKKSCGGNRSPTWCRYFLPHFGSQTTSTVPVRPIFFPQDISSDVPFSTWCYHFCHLSLISEYSALAPEIAFSKLFSIKAGFSCIRSVMMVGIVPCALTDNVSRSFRNSYLPRIIRNWTLIFKSVTVYFCHNCALSRELNILSFIRSKSIDKRAIAGHPSTKTGHAPQTTCISLKIPDNRAFY